MIKNSIFLIFLFFLSFSSQGQTKKWSIGLGLGGSAVNGNFDELKAKGFGLNWYLNTMLNLNSNISLGIELNSNLVFSETVSSAVDNSMVISGLLLKGDYTFGSKRIRPFVGVMVGPYRIKHTIYTLSDVGLSFDRPITFGFAPELGVKWKSIQIAVAYHVTGKHTVLYSNPFNILSGDAVDNSFESNYNLLQFSFGWNIGVGKRKLESGGDEN